MVDFLDAEVENADWIKVGFFDLDLSAAEVEVMPIADLEHTVGLPAWEAAPDHLKAIADRRFAEVAD